MLTVELPWLVDGFETCAVPVDVSAGRCVGRPSNSMLVSDPEWRGPDDGTHDDRVGAGDEPGYEPGRRTGHRPLDVARRLVRNEGRGAVPRRACLPASGGHRPRSEDRRAASRGALRRRAAARRDVEV